MSVKNMINYVTEDNIFVRTIHVANVPENENIRTEIPLREYFADFGEISVIISHNGQWEWSNKNYYIIYKEPESVVRVLNQNVHILHNEQLIVKIAPDWFQPEYFDDVKPPEVDISISNFDIPNDSLLKLNDDCLSYIFSGLNLLDQVKLSGLCSRLNAIGEMGFRKIKIFDLNPIALHTPMEAKTILRKIGKNFEHIKFSEFLQMFSGMPSICWAYFYVPLCPNLKIIEFDGRLNLTSSTIEWLMPVIKDLEVLILQDCNVTDDIVIILQNCKKLKKLSLAKNLKLSGLGLDTLSTSIMDLDLTFCYNIKTENLINLFKVAKFKKVGLEEINRTILEHLSKVESLEAISFFYKSSTVDLNLIANIPNLKDLFIRCRTDLDNNFFEVLEKEKSNTIERLLLPGASLNDLRRKVICNLKNLKDLCIRADDKLLNELTNNNISLNSFILFKSDNISEAALLNFVEKSKNIKTLDITSCPQFCNNSVHKFLEKLKNLQRPFYLEVRVSKKCYLSSPRLIDNDFKHLLKVSFHKSFEDTLKVYAPDSVNENVFFADHFQSDSDQYDDYS